MLAQFRRCYYEITKMHIDRVDNAQRRNLLLLDYLYSFYMSSRFLFVAYLLSIGFKTAYPFRRYDPFVKLFHHLSDQIDAFVPIEFVIFGILNLAMQTELYRLDPSTLTWRWWRQLVVQNQDDYYDCMLAEDEISALVKQKEKVLLARLDSESPLLGQIVPSFVLHFYFNTKARWLVWKNLEHIDQREFFSRKLSIMPNISKRLRRKTILMLVVADLMGVGLQMISPIFVIVTPIIFWHTITEGTVWFGVLWFHFEALCLAYELLRLLRAAHFFVCCCVFVIPGNAWPSDEQLEAIEQCIVRYRKRGQPIPERVLTNFLRDHNKVCYLFVAGKREIFSNVEFYFLLTNIPVNIDIIKRFVFTEVAPLVKAMMWALTVVQCISFYISTGPLAHVCSRLHAPMATLPALQSCLRGWPSLLYKLKFDDLLKRLGNGPKYAITIGPLREVTHEVIAEMIGIYVGYMLMVFGMQISAQTQQQEQI